MQIRNFNQAEAPLISVSTQAAPAHDANLPEASNHGPAPDAETALLRARIEHLELVVETARSLMTANQERLLRRLHDLPHEMMALTAKLARQTPAQGSTT